MCLLDVVREKRSPLLTVRTNMIVMIIITLLLIMNAFRGTSIAFN